MTRGLRPELEAAIESAGRIAREVLAPNAEQVDRENAYPYESTAAVGSSGLLGLLVPRDYGGLESNPRTFCRIVLQRTCNQRAQWTDEPFGLGRAWICRVKHPGQQKTHGRAQRVDLGSKIHLALEKLFRAGEL